MSDEIKKLPYVSVKKAIPIVERCMQTGLVPIMKGSPGIGKSAIGHSLAKKWRLKLIDQRLNQLDPTDLNGYPVPNMETKRSDFLAPKIFPLERDPVPQGYDGWLLFFDELTNASNALQAAAYKIILDRKIGDEALHRKCAIICAGNLATDRAAANTLNTAMQSRLVHLNIESNIEDWTEWAQMNNIDHRVVSYVNWKPDFLNNFNPSHKDNTFACERTWDFVSRYLQPNKPLTAEDKIAVSGMVGVGVANEFMAFCDIYKDLPKFSEIISDPLNIPMNDRPDIQYALAGTISEKIDMQNFKAVLAYVTRMPIEFQIITLKGAIRKIPELTQQKEIMDWSMKHVSRLSSVS